MSRRVLVARLDNDGDVLLAGPAIRAVAAGADASSLLVRPARAPGRRAAARRRRRRSSGARRGSTREPAPGRPATTSTRSSTRLAALAARRGAHPRLLPPEPAADRAAAAPRRRRPIVAATSVDYPGSLLDVPPPHRRRRPRGRARARPRRRAGFALPAGRRRPRWRVARRGRAARRAPTRRPTSSCTPAPPCPRAPGRPSATPSSSRALVAAGRRVVVTGGPASPRSPPRRRPAAPASRPRRPHDARRAGRRARRARDVVVVGNTGPAHLAAAVGTPVVSLFAPTVPAGALAAVRVPHELLGDQRRRRARGCRARAARCPGHPCLSGVGAAGDVLAAVERARRPRAGRWRREDPALARARLVDDRVRPGPARRTSAPGPARPRARRRRASART